jgi:hypothetical protein
MTLGRDWCRLLLIQSGYAPASRAAGTVSASRVMMRLPTRSASQSRVAHDFCHPPHGEPGRVGDGLVRHQVAANLKHVAVPNLGDGGDLDVGEQAWLHTDPDLRLNCEGRPENGDPVPRQW